MNKILCTMAASLIISFFIGINANATTYSFDYAGYNWGVMDVEINYDTDIMEVTYTASSTLPWDPVNGITPQATGFGFDFNPDLSPSIFNSGVGPYSDPDPSLTWVELSNLNPLPNPINSSVIDKADFTFGATEGNANNINPPGILPGESDTFYLDFSSMYDLLPTEDIINIVSVRLQSLPNEINGGSLNLVGTAPVPEPTTMLLFGAGLAGLAGYRRKQKR